MNVTPLLCGICMREMIFYRKRVFSKFLHLTQVLIGGPKNDRITSRNKVRR